MNINLSTIDFCPGGGSAELQEKSVTITANGTTEVTPDAGYDGMSKTTVVTNVPSEAKPEETLTQTITANGSQTFNPTAGSVFDKAVITTNIHPADSLTKVYTSNGVKSETGEWTNATITIDVEPSLQAKTSEMLLSETSKTISADQGYDGLSSVTITHAPVENNTAASITTNGTHVITPDTGYDATVQVTATVNVQPTLQSKSANPTTSSQTISPDSGYDGLSSVSVSAVTSAIDANILAGNIKDGVTILGVEGTYDNQKPEETLTQTITANGSQTFNPTSGHVFDKAVITTDIHPSASLSETYTTNGTKTISGEFNGGTVVVNVPEQKPEETLTQTITANGTQTYNPTSGSVFDKATITVNVPSDIKPEETLTQTITSNGSQTFNPTTGHVFDKAVITTNIHPADSLTKTYTSNGVKTETGEWTNATITINVPEQKPEETLTQTISANGTTTYNPTSGSVFDKATITVAVPDPELQDKTVSPSTSQQVISADQGYYGLDEVTVNAVTAAIDTNIVAGNIKNGTTILGVTGTYDNQKPEDTISETYTTNGVKTLTPTSGHVFSGGSVTINVPEQKPEEVLTQTITANGEYSYDPTAGSVFSGADITVNVTAPAPSLQDKTVSPTTSQQVVSADEGYDGLDEVTVSAVTSAIDANIIAGNIKDGVTILGVEGTFEGGKPEETFTITPTNSSQTVTPATGKVFSSGTVLGYDVDPVYNAIDNLNIGTPTANLQNKTATATTSQQSITADAGYVGLGTVTLNAVTSAIDANIVADNIKKDVAILGVTGTYEGGGGVYVAPAGMKFSNNSFSTFPYMDTSNITDMSSFFATNSNLTTIPAINTSNATSMYMMFDTCYALTSVPTLDLSSCTTTKCMFDSDQQLTTASFTNMSGVQWVENMFNRCYALQTVTGLDFSSVTSSISLTGSNLTNLTHMVISGKLNSYRAGFNKYPNLDYDSIKSILIAAENTDMHAGHASDLQFNNTIADQGGELAALVASCTAKGWLISGLTLN